jgi:hypothetical protein
VATSAAGKASVSRELQYTVPAKLITAHALKVQVNAIETFLHVLIGAMRALLTWHD